MIREGGTTIPDRLALLFFQVLLARTPDEFELQVLQQQFDTNLSRYRANQEQAQKLIAAGESKPEASIDPVE